MVTYSTVPEGQTIIARRFNAGDRVRALEVPEGRLKIVEFKRPVGTQVISGQNPALKRRAIILCPSGTTEWVAVTC